VHEGLIDWDWESRGVALKSQLQRCRGAMLLSRFDAQPRSLREALWLGLPIIATPECGFGEVMAMLGTGQIVDGDCPSAIQAAFETVSREEVDIAAARRLLDRRETGRFLMSALVAVAGRTPMPLSYHLQHTAAAALTVPQSSRRRYPQTPAAAP
jgi:hypothetical protein